MNLPSWFILDLKLTTLGVAGLFSRNILETGGQDLAGALGGLGAPKGVLFLWLKIVSGGNSGFGRTPCAGDCSSIAPLELIRSEAANTKAERFTRQILFGAFCRVISIMQCYSADPVPKESPASSSSIVIDPIGQKSRYGARR